MIARALVHKPKLLILDEPTAGVDIEMRLGMWEYLRRINKEGTTIILTTHYLEEAEQLCRTVAIINKGEVKLHKPMKELLAEDSGEKLEDVYLGIIQEDNKENN
jgi:ABC-2 type transport system ATP-binding protein